MVFTFEKSIPFSIKHRVILFLYNHRHLIFFGLGLRFNSVSTKCNANLCLHNSFQAIFFEFGLDFIYNKGWLPDSLMWISNIRYKTCCTKAIKRCPSKSPNKLKSNW